MINSNKKNIYKNYEQLAFLILVYLTEVLDFSCILSQMIKTYLNFVSDQIIFNVIFYLNLQNYYSKNIKVQLTDKENPMYFYNSIHSLPHAYRTLPVSLKKVRDTPFRTLHVLNFFPLTKFHNEQNR